MDVNDRGTKKWTSLMLPEHIKMLDELWKEDDKKVKPILDEQQKIEFDMMLQLALKDDLTVGVTYYADYDYHTVKDKLSLIDSLKRCLRFERATLELYLDDIIEVTIL